MPLDIEEEIINILNSNDIVLFMKGNIHTPQCGFAAGIINILQSLNLSFITVDVLNNPNMRKGIKNFSHAGISPHLYIKKEFIGGYDTVNLMHQQGKLKKLLQQHQLIKD